MATGEHSDPWYDRALNAGPRVAEILTAAVAAIALAGLARGAYRRTLGRRRERYARLDRLGTNAQLSFFTAVLGEPPAMRRTILAPLTRYTGHGEAYRVELPLIEATYIDRDSYVHAVADADETVHVYSVTTRSRRFRPKFRPPGGFSVERRWPLRKWARFRYRYEANRRVKLGKTRFAELGRPGRAAAWVGAHNYHTSRTTTSATPATTRRSSTASTTPVRRRARRSS